MTLILKRINNSSTTGKWHIWKYGSGDVLCGRRNWSKKDDRLSDYVTGEIKADSFKEAQEEVSSKFGEICANCEIVLTTGGD